MKTINIYGDNRAVTGVKTRVGCRGIVVQDGRILVTHEINTGYYLIPGGALETGETPEECCIREVIEETGYTVNPINCYLTINEYYDDREYISYYFICKATGKGEQQLTKTEAAYGLISEWMSIGELSDIHSEYSKYAATNNDKSRSYIREYTALTEYLKIKESE